jgi:hypothetical protein
MRRALLAIFALLLAGVLCTGWYVYEKGFTKKWRKQVTEEFRRRGVEVSLRRLTLDPFRGLVAKEIRVYDAKDRRRTLAVIDEVLLQVNYANLLRGQAFLDALDLRDANLSFPIDPAAPNGAKIEIARLNARLFLPLQQIYLAHAEAEVFGIKVSASGRLINPQAFQPSAPMSPGPSPLATRIIEEIQGLTFEAESPVVSVAFTGDLADPGKILIELAVRGERIRRSGYLFETIDLTGQLRDRVVEVKQLTLRDGTGTLHGRGTFDLSSRAIDARVRSRLDLPGLARSFRLTLPLSEFASHGPPTIDLSVTAKMGEKPDIQAFGKLVLPRFSYRAVMFEGLRTDFAWAGDRWTARDVQLVHGSGQLSGDVQQIPGDVRARLRSTINPQVLRPVLSGKALEALMQFEFQDSPEFEIEASGADLSPEALNVTGRMKVGAGSFRNVPAQSAAADFRYSGRVLSVQPFEVKREEGSGSGGLVFDFNRDEVRLIKIEANVFPPEVAIWIDPKLVKDLLPYRFKTQPPRLLLDGLVHTKRGKTTRLNVQVEAPGGMEYTFLKRELRFPEIRGDLLFTPDRLRISDLNGSLFGGNVNGAAEISLDRTKPSHSASLQLQDVDFASLTKLYFNYENSRGRLSGRYDFTGRGDDARSMEGRGELAVREGNVFAIPFLGPLSGILNSIVPGMGYNLARKATTSFTIRSGVIATDDLAIEGNGFAMYGSGKLFFLDDRMDFDMRINARGLPGILLFPVSKLFEYTSDEKLSKPSWRAKVVPRF